MAVAKKSAQNNKNQKQHRGEHRDKAEGGDNRRPTADVAALINAVAHDNRADREQKSRQERRREFREWVTIVVVLIATAAAVTQAMILSGQLDEMISAGKQTERGIGVFQAIFETMRDANQQAQRDRRPQISIDATIAEPLSLGPNAISARGIFTMRNDGAVDTKGTIVAKMFLQSKQKDFSLSALQNGICKDAGIPKNDVKAGGGVASETIALKVQGSDFKKGVHTEHDLRNFIIIPIPESTDYINPILVGCANYGPENDRHQIRFIGTLTRNSSKMSGLIVKNEIVMIPANELSVEITVTSNN